MWTRILVPLDTSSFAEQALSYAAGLAERARATLQLVCVHTSVPADLTIEKEERYLAALAARLEPRLAHNVTCDVVTDEGEPAYPPPDASRVAQLLARFARDADTDLIVMATHGRGGVRRALLGSVADALLRSSPRPVLLIPPHGQEWDVPSAVDRELRHIVIALDGSKSAELAIPYALQLGSLYRADYSLVRVSTLTGWNALQPVSAPENASTRLEFADYLERVAGPLRRQDVVETHVLDDFAAAPAIVRYAERHGADAIALATSGAGRIHRLLLGSVADRVVRTSDIPVLVCNERALEPAAKRDNEAASGAVAV